MYITRQNVYVYSVIWDGVIMNSMVGLVNIAKQRFGWCDIVVSYCKAAALNINNV